MPPPLAPPLEPVTTRLRFGAAAVTAVVPDDVDEAPSAEDQPEPYERQPGESAKAWGLFQVYRNLGARRSIRLACQQFYGADYSTSKVRNAHEWSRHGHWVDRAASWDGHLDRNSRLAQEEQVQEMGRRHVSVARATLAKAIEALKELHAKEMGPLDVARLIDLSTKLERLALGQVTEAVRQEVKGETKLTLQVVERIVPVRADTPGRSAAAALPELADMTDDAPREIIDTGSGPVPDFELPDEPPAGR